MYCVRKYKRKKNKKIFYWSISIIVMALIAMSFFSNKIESDNYRNMIKAETVIEKSIDDIVGISSSNGENVVWGSGVIISKQGFVLTNEHLLGDGRNCYVTVGLNKKIKADVAWANTELDLAILRVNEKFSNSAVLVESTDLKLGQEVYAIGNPIGSDFEKSVTKGIISGLNRNLEFEENGKKFYLNNLIQTDASINPGNSGGALINNAGQLIGINTIKITSAESMSFAIPVDVINPIIERLEKGENFSEPHLGIWCYDKYSVGKLNLEIKLDKGVYIAQVNADSSSEKIGLKVGDVILQLDENNINTISDFRKYIYEKNIGDTVNLTIKRAAKEYKVDVKLEK